MLRILIADDHAIVRKGLIDLLRDSFAFVEVQEAVASDDLFDFATNGELWDVIIADINMPGAGGLETVRKIVAGNPAQKCLLLSFLPQDQYAKAAFRAGAWGYITKSSAAEELVSAVQTVLAGRRYLPDSIKSGIDNDEFLQDFLLGFEMLSERELEVYHGLVAGKTVAELAQTLQIGESTINTYRSRIFKKLNLNSTADLIRFDSQRNAGQ